MDSGAIYPKEMFAPKADESNSGGAFACTKGNAVRWSRTFFTVALGTLVIACMTLSYFQMLKYITGQVTVAYSIEKYDELDFPALSICPGFKKDKVIELEWPLRITDPTLYGTNKTYNNTYPTTLPEMEALWNDITYSLDEVIYEVGTQMMEGDTAETRRYRPEEVLNKRVGCHELKELSTVSGKCYTLYTHCKVKPHQYVHMRFTFENIVGNSIPIAIHQPKAYLGNNAHFWPGPVSVEELKRDSNLDIVLTKETKERKEGSAKEEEYYDCVLNKIYTSAMKEKDKLCYFPSFGSMLGNVSSAVPPCDTEKKHFDNNFPIFNYMYLLFHSGCPKPKEETSYKISRRENSQYVHLKRISNVYVGFETMDVIVEAEYELQDFYAIVATLGGSIGIFLGWSMLDLVKMVSGLFTKMATGGEKSG